MDLYFCNKKESEISDSLMSCMNFHLYPPDELHIDFKLTLSGTVVTSSPSDLYELINNYK